MRTSNRVLRVAFRWEISTIRPVRHFTKPKTSQMRIGKAEIRRIIELARTRSQISDREAQHRFVAGEEVSHSGEDGPGQILVR